MLQQNETICAISTPPGVGGIAVIRVSGKTAFAIVNKSFSKDLTKVKTHTLSFGTFKDGNQLIDEVVCAVFRNPQSFTGEDVVEISCHGSNYVQNKIVQVLLANGCTMAQPGEFTLRAFLNGKMDLSQAEAVADLIHSNSEGAHELAMKQMRGGFSNEINMLREELINFASLIELELDFSEEDVEFADRTQLQLLITKINNYLNNLIESFKVGNVIKNGIPVAIVGLPNVGKSTLLNTLLNEERAIVSNIPGTTRDTIEDEIVIKGQTYRFIDTAGIRETKDHIESKGIERTYIKIDEAEIILYLIDVNEEGLSDVVEFGEEFKSRPETKNKEVILIINKIDAYTGGKDELTKITQKFDNHILISAKEKTNITEIKEALSKYIAKRIITDSSVVTNQRHYEALTNANNALIQVQEGMDMQISGDLMAMDIRDALHHLGTITGAINTDDLLGNIFANFCIGK